MRQAAMKELARRELARRQEARTGTPNIIEEMHPDISSADRAIVKNFSQSPEKSANYLKKHNPQLDTRVWDGRVLVKGKNELDWKVLDPDTGFFSTDILNDAADIAYDVGSGIVEGTAAVGGAIGGALAGWGVGAVPAAMATSAATAAGSEALRQSIGSGLGIDNELGEAAGDTLLSAAIGGAVPALGAAVRPAIKNAGKLAKGSISKLTQATADDVDVFLNQKDKLDNIIRSDSGFTDVYSDIGREIAEKEKVFKSEINNMFSDLRKQGIAVDISNVRGVYDSKIVELESKIARGAASDADVGLRDAIKAERDQIFSRSNDMVDLKSTNRDYSKVKGQALNDGSQLSSQIDNKGGIYPTGVINRSARDTSDELTQGVLRTETDTVVDEGLSLSDYLSGRTPSRSVRSDLADNQDIGDALDLRQSLAARANFKNRSDLQKSLASANLSESLAARGYGELGKSIDEAASQFGSKEAREMFKSHVEFVGDIANNFKSPEALERFMKAANKGDRKVLAEKLTAIDKRFGTNLKDKGKIISTANALQSSESGTLVDAIRPKSGLELIGGAIGAKAAWASGAPWLIPITLTAGAAVGRKLGSLKAARRYVDFIVEVEGSALNYDKKARDVLKKQLYRSVSGGDALREALKGTIRESTNDRG